MSKEKLIDSTVQSLCAITNRRLFRTERGYQGEFFCVLHNLLREQGIVDGVCILEMEHQKSARHGIRQRPDIILHIPVEVSMASVTENNFAVWALKREASAEEARDDFGKLDEMFDILKYPLGFFINIDSTLHHFNEYTGSFADRLVSFAVALDKPNVTVKMAYWKDNAIVEVAV